MERGSIYNEMGGDCNRKSYHSNVLVRSNIFLNHLKWKHYKMSNENFKHHENQEKVEGGLTRTFQGTLFLILLCELNGPVEFRNHIFVRLCHENYVHLTLQTMFIFEKKPKKIGVRAIILEMAAKMYLYVKS